jgi:hypothetical protein
MGPKTLEAYQLALQSGRLDFQKWIAGSQHWLVGIDLVRDLEKIISDLRGVNKDPWEFQLSLPGPRVVIEFDAGVQGQTVAVFVRDGDGVHMLLHANDFPLHHAMTFFEHSSAIQPSRSLEAMGEEWVIWAWSIGAVSDILFAIAAEPRLISKIPPSRQVRRRAKAGLAEQALPEWFSLSWTMGERTKPKVGAADEHHGVALHIARAHWRNIGRPTAKSVIRPGLSGHWIWIPYSIKGHPRFGIKLNHYMPKLSSTSARSIENVARTACLDAGHDLIERWSGRKLKRYRGNFLST